MSWIIWFFVCILLSVHTLQTHHVYSTSKWRGNERYVSTWNVCRVLHFLSCWCNFSMQESSCFHLIKSSHAEVFLEKGVLKICSKFTGEHPYRNLISIKLLCNFIEINLRHGCSPANLRHIFRTPFTNNTSGRLLLFDAYVLFGWYWFKSFFIIDFFKWLNAA